VVLSYAKAGFSHLLSVLVSDSGRKRSMEEPYVWEKRQE